MSSSLAIDWTAFFFLLIAATGFYLLLRRKKKEPSNTYRYPSLSSFRKMTPTIRTKWMKLPYQLKLFSLCFFGAALLDPRLIGTIEEKKPVHPLPTEGVALFLVLDRSGSMGVPMLDEGGNSLEFKTKLDILKEISTNFVKKRPQDLIGLVGFARVPEVLSPLTLDHSTVLNDLKDLKIVKRKINDGTAIGYAIYKTASIIAATKQFRKLGYDIRGSAIILVTDGFQNPHVDDEGDPLRAIGIEEAANYAKEQGVKLYLVSIDPLINDQKYAPQRRLMKRSAELTGGNLYTAQATTDLRAIYQSINKLEKSKVPLAAIGEKTPFIRPLRLKSYALVLIALGMCLLFTAILLETTLLRKVP